MQQTRKSQKGQISYCFACYHILLQKATGIRHVILYDFAASPADVRAGSAIAGQYDQHSTPQTEEEIEVGRQLGAQVAQQLVAEIRNMGVQRGSALLKRPGMADAAQLWRRTAGVA